MADRAVELKKIHKITAGMGWMMAACVPVYAVVIEYLVRSGNLEGFEFAFPGTKAAEYMAIALVIIYYILILSIKKRSYAKTSSLPPEKFPAAASRLYHSSVIIFALCESVAVLGIVMFFFTGNRPDFYILALASILYFIIFFPRLPEWNKLLRTGSGL